MCWSYFSIWSFGRGHKEIWHHLAEHTKLIEQKLRNDFKHCTWKPKTHTQNTLATNSTAQRQCSDSIQRERVEEDGPKQATFNLINHIQQRKGGERRRQERQTHNISSTLSIRDQRGGRGDKDRELPYVYLIDHVGPVGGGQHSDVSELLDAVHLCQELSQDPVAYTTGARRAEGVDGNTRQMSGQDPKRGKQRWDWCVDGCLYGEGKGHMLISQKLGKLLMA